MNNNTAPDEELNINIRNISDISGQAAFAKYITQINIGKIQNRDLNSVIQEVHKDWNPEIS